MRTQNPNDVVDSFQYNVDESLELWRQIQSKTGTTGEIAKRVSIDAFLRLAVTFESFRSDWQIAAINRESSKFKKDLTSKVEQAIRGRWRALDGLATVDLPKHPNVELLREILAPDGDHVSLGSHKIWKERAEEQLCDPWLNVVLELPNEDRSLMNAVIAIRNLLSHQSVRASDSMNEALRKLHGHHDYRLRRGERRVQPSGVGSYLNADMNGDRRVEIYHQRLGQLAERLRVL